ncbi:hypothetical protein ACJQWK_09513 [Exserohilum turcicum]
MTTGNVRKAVLEVATTHAISATWRQLTGLQKSCLYKIAQELQLPNGWRAPRCPPSFSQRLCDYLNYVLNYIRWYTTPPKPTEKIQAQQPARVGPPCASRRRAQVLFFSPGKIPSPGHPHTTRETGAC